jgi:hypothetical protein
VLLAADSTGSNASVSTCAVRRNAVRTSH